mmetsp:Transcript_3206/g.7529  ORF Transcript_3206/g.7529 Transcript_3206/m.7529 type:complete len:430 (-) Transcript_3206:2158-3447(-)
MPARAVHAQDRVRRRQPEELPSFVVHVVILRSDSVLVRQDLKDGPERLSAVDEGAEVPGLAVLCRDRDGVWKHKRGVDLSHAHDVPDTDDRLVLAPNKVRVMAECVVRHVHNTLLHYPVGVVGTRVPLDESRIAGQILPEQALELAVNHLRDPQSALVQRPQVYSLRDPAAPQVIELVHKRADGERSRKGISERKRNHTICRDHARLHDVSRANQLDAGHQRHFRPIAHRHHRAHTQNLLAILVREIADDHDRGGRDIPGPTQLHLMGGGGLLLDAHFCKDLRLALELEEDVVGDARLVAVARVHVLRRDLPPHLLVRQLQRCLRRQVVLRPIFQHAHQVLGQVVANHVRHKHRPVRNRNPAAVFRLLRHSGVLAPVLGPGLGCTEEGADHVRRDVDHDPFFRKDGHGRPRRGVEGGFHVPVLYPSAPR